MASPSCWLTVLWSVWLITVGTASNSTTTTTTVTTATTKSTTACSVALENIFKSAYSGEQWALEMLDAAGKPQPGLFNQGNRFPTTLDRIPLYGVRFIGSFDQCMDVQTPDKFQTLFCSADMQVKKVGGFSWDEAKHVVLDICAPDVCSTDQLTQFVQNYTTTLGISIDATVNDVTCQEKIKPLSDKAIAALYFLAVFSSIVILATSYDLIFRQGSLGVFGNKSDTQDKGLVTDLLLSFSIYKNGTKLLNTQQASIGCITGIRLISMCWIVLTHIYLFGEGTMENALYWWTKVNGYWSTQILHSMTVSVDTFYVISGLLTTFQTLKKFRTQKPSVSYFLKDYYLRRYWRLTPVYMIMIIIYVCLFKYIWDGPIWPQHEVERDGCADSWWTNMLYINNVFNVEYMCILWSWYMSNEMQFFILSPIFLLLLHYYGHRSIIVHGCVTGVAVGVCFYLCYLLNIFPNVPPQQGIMRFFYYIGAYYILPTTHIGSYLSGMVTGYLLRSTDCKTRLSPVTVAVGWSVCSLTLFGVVFGLRGHNAGDEFGPEMTALYCAIHRLLWSMCICWIVFACANGYGGIVNKVLSWAPLAPVGAVSYSFYLIHPILIFYFGTSLPRLLYVDFTNSMLAFLGVLSITFPAAAIFHILFEMPFTNIENAFKDFRERRRKLKDPSTKEAKPAKKRPTIVTPEEESTASLIFLHGLSDQGTGWADLFTDLSLKYIRCVLPHASSIPVSIYDRREMNAWYDIKGLRLDSQQDEDGIIKASKELQTLIDNEIKSGIPAERIFIGGFSQGGAVALYTAFATDTKIGGVIALSTCMPLHQYFIDDNNPKYNKHVPVLQCHGQDDPSISIFLGQATSELIQQFNSKVEFKSYSSLGHGYSQEEMADIKSFLEKHLLDE